MPFRTGASPWNCRAVLPCQALPVLYMSAYPVNDVFHRGSPELGVPFLQKPFGSEALLAAVQAVLAPPLVSRDARRGLAVAGLRRSFVTTRRISTPHEGPLLMGVLKHIGGPAGLLGQPLTSISHRRMPWFQRRTRRSRLRGEQVHLATSEPWLGREWELRLTSVYGTIFDIRLEARAANPEDAAELLIVVFLALQESLGAPSRQAEGSCLWIAEDGNAVLQHAQLGSARRIRVLFTSSNVRALMGAAGGWAPP